MYYNVLCRSCLVNSKVINVPYIFKVLYWCLVCSVMWRVGFVCTFLLQGTYHDAHEWSGTNKLKWEYYTCNDTHFGCIDISPALYHATAIYCMIQYSWFLQMDRQPSCFILTRSVKLPYNHSISQNTVHNM